MKTLNLDLDNTTFLGKIFHEEDPLNLNILYHFCLHLTKGLRCFIIFRTVRKITFPIRNLFNYFYKMLHYISIQFHKYLLQIKIKLFNSLILK